MNLDIARLHLRPEDTLVLKIKDTIISAETSRRLREWVRAETGHQRVLVIDRGSELSVLTPTAPSDAEDAA